jgi:hypothetical protein
MTTLQIVTSLRLQAVVVVVPLLDTAVMPS